MTNRSLPIAWIVALAVTLGVAAPAAAQGDRPRFLILLDNSASMAENLAGNPTHGDGSESQPGCDMDGKSTAGWRYDDSKLFLAKQAVIDTVSAFGAAEFALATYSHTLLGQACTADSECPGRDMGSSCAPVPGSSSPAKFCGYAAGDTYRECALGGGCLNCANPADANDVVYDLRAFECSLFHCSYAAGCIGGQVLVGFPSAGKGNLLDIYRWIDGKEDVPPLSEVSNRELRATTATPIASALDSLRAWLLEPNRTDIGPGSGLLSATAGAADPRSNCRPYSIIVITDGEDTCSPNTSSDPLTAAESAFKAGIGVYVVGFGTGFNLALNNMAMAGSGQRQAALFASDRGELTAKLGDIVLNALNRPKCACDAGCSDDTSTFTNRGKPCSVGVGRCKRAGAYSCNAAGDDVQCEPVGMCGVDPLTPGAPTQEQCGIAPGCLAPTPEDCADDDCDGEVDEGLSCDCASRPETCNGLDDNCDGVIDNVPEVPCGLAIGACKAGVLRCKGDSPATKAMVCEGAIAPSTEVCDGIDNDCDGVVDEIVRDCFPDGQAGCALDAKSGAWKCVGACGAGKQRCTRGAWQGCVGATTPTVEIACDTFDNDCNGTVDENGPAGTEACYPALAIGCDLKAGTCKGECKLGRIRCATDRPGQACLDAVLPTKERCNGKDDDCDGLIDEDFPTLGQSCNEKSCQGAGKVVCNASGNDVECSVKSEGPTPEICDGLDNDCDTLIDEAPGPGESSMPGVGVTCGSNVGECKQGLSTCQTGKIVCTGVAPVPEICDGKDNDCNGSADDNLVAPAQSCNPPGIVSGAPLIGECRTGTFQCMGAEGWVCKGGQGPVPEVCDGKDNDCDGVVDTPDSCSLGYICIESECVPRCSVQDERTQCSADRVCKEGACQIKECVRRPCAAGFVCQKDGSCADLCAAVSCPEGASCVMGTCVDCYRTGCPAGQRCLDRHCAPDPCLNVDCGGGTYCRNGSCVVGCGTLLCPTGEVCKQALCVPDPCRGECSSSEVCDPVSGTCRSSRCASIACPSGQACIESTGACIFNPCERVRCPNNQVCKLDFAGEPDCVSVLPSPNVIVSASGKGGTSLGCQVGFVPTSSSRGHSLAALLMLLLVVVRRAKKQR